MSDSTSSMADSPVFKDILCAVDGSKASAAAVKMAACLAAPGGRVTFLAVTGLKGSAQNAQGAISPSHAEAIVDTAKLVAEKAGVESTGIVDPNRPTSEVILERARDHDLLVIGAPAGSWLGELIVGGVAAATLSQFTTPMLVVRESFDGSLQGRHIVVASDGLDGSDEIVKLAGDLASNQGSPVTLLHVLGAESASQPNEKIEMQTHALEQAVPGMSDVCTESGKAWEAIVAAAKRTDAAIAVLGSRRLHGLRALGSVSRHVVYDAPCSVLLLPPRQ